MAGNLFTRLFRRPDPVAPDPAAPLLAPLLLHHAPAAPKIEPEAYDPGVAYVRIRTGRDHWLCVDPPEAPGKPSFVGMSTTMDKSRALIAIIPLAQRQVCFLLAPDGSEIAFRGDGLRAVAVSAMVVQTDTLGVVRLKHPRADMRYMKVTQPGEGGPDGWVIFDGFGDGAQNLFTLQEVPQSEITTGLRQLAAEIGRGAAQPASATLLLRKLRGGVLRPELAESFVRLLPRDELQYLARLLTNSAADLAFLASAMPHDRFINQAFPTLIAWVKNREPAGVAGVLDSPPGDEYAGETVEGVGQVQAGQALLSLARRLITPRRMACILATARNEGPYLLEWIAYHRSIGFEHIFLYTNDNNDGSEALLEALAAQGVITLIRNSIGPRLPVQYKAYAHALQLLPQLLDYRWTAVIDIDEYFAFNADMFGSALDFLAWEETQPVDAIALCWSLHVASGTDVWSDAPSIERFPRRERQLNPHVKSIFRSNMFWGAHAHYPYPQLNMPFLFKNEDGAAHHVHGVTKRSPAFAVTPGIGQAWIVHYILRTAEEALCKLARGRADKTGPVAERHAEQAHYIFNTFLALARPEVTVEDTRIQRCAAGQAAELATLRALPGVAAIEASLKEAFAQRLERAVRDFLAEPVLPGEALSTARFRNVLLLREDATSVFAD